MIVILLMVLLQIKHWYIDFVDQTDDEVKCKGIYGNLIGIGHSVKHGLFTGVLFFNITEFWFVIGLIDFFLHYHIDWIKMNYGCQDLKSKTFWVHLGLDQLAHQLCYITYIGMLLT